MKKVLLTLVFFLPSVLAMAQPGDDPSPVPIDAGIGFLAAAGIAYGIKKYRDAQKS